MNENKRIDSLRHRKLSKVNPSYKRSYNRIVIKKSGISKRAKRLIPLFLIAISIFLVCQTVLQSKTYQALILMKELGNQSILVGFQNSAELRPTGGFWGSFAVLDTESSIFDATIYFDTNPYKQDNQLLKESETELPAPMREQWKDRPQSFVNANWPASFPESAKTLQWYFGQGWGDKTVDGVIALSSLSIIDLLNLTGPIDLSDNTVVTGDNFTQIMSEKIDRDYWLSEENKSINEPKSIIKELFPKLIDKTKKLPKIALYRYLIQQMEQGRISAYFNNPNLNKLVEKLGIDGKLYSYDSDYLSINNANISGDKTSLNVTQHINYEVQTKNAETLSALTITRSHKDLWPHKSNTNYTRIFTPLGSSLVKAQLGDTDITQSVLVQQESGRTVFGFWFNTDSGQQKSALIQYILPAKIANQDYLLTYQKQNGTMADWLNITVSDKILFAGKFDKIKRVFSGH